MSGRAQEVRLAITTAPDAETAERLVRELVEERVVACGNIVPGLTSIFRWDDAVQTEEEVLVLFKTTADAVESLIGRVREMHPYDVPEVLVWPIADGSPDYLDWVGASVAAP